MGPQVIISLNDVLALLKNLVSQSALGQRSAIEYRNLFILLVYEVFDWSQPLKIEPSSFHGELMRMGLTLEQADDIYHRTLMATVDAITAHVPDVSDCDRPNYQYRIIGCDIIVTMPQSFN